MHACFATRYVAVAGLVTMAILFGAVPTSIAQEVTLEVWSHEADEPAKVAFRELAAQKSREGASRGQGQDYVVREKSSVRGTQDCAAGRQGS